MLARSPPGWRFLLLLPLFCCSAFAAQIEHLQLPSGQAFEVDRYQGTGRSLILWLPSERGFGEPFLRHAERLAQLGHDVWLADLHANYFVEPGRSSIAQFPLHDVIAILDAAVSSGSRDIVLLGSGRGAQLTLIAAREWQLRNPGATRIKGALLMHAYLYLTRPVVGQVADYLPIATTSNLPVYLLDAQYSTKSARIRELAEVLAIGGSQVYTEVLKGVQGGFYARDDRDNSFADQAAKRDFAKRLSRAAGLLERTTTPESALASRLDTRQFSQYRRQQGQLTALTHKMAAPRLELDGFRRSRYRLQANRGSVLLVNFWATWCKPCVDEIPSLHRLKASIADPSFEIITVNVGENRQRIERFLQKTPVELPLLMDYDSKAAKDWKLYVYPSSYLIDRQGDVRYAYLGALEWDSPKNLTIIRNLLQQP